VGVVEGRVGGRGRWREGSGGWERNCRGGEGKLGVGEWGGRDGVLGDVHKNEENLKKVLKLC
jgi:hypothetical protein